MFYLKPVPLLLLFHLFIPIYSFPIRIGGCNVTFGDPKEFKQVLIKVQDSNPELIEYNWETFMWAMAGGFLSACILFLLFYFIAWWLKERMKYSTHGRKEESALAGFFLGITTVYSILQRAKTPYVNNHKEDFLGLDYSNAKTAAIFIVGGTFLGLCISLLIAIMGRNKLKVMLTTFWGPQFGQLVGMITFDIGHNIKEFQTGEALMALGRCLIFSFIGCVALYTFKYYNRKRKDKSLTPEEKHDIFLEGSIKFAALYYILGDAGRFD